MRYAINAPNFGEYADPRAVMRLARRVEAAGWDGLFVWDHILVDPSWRVPIADPWTLLAAAGAVTERIRLGPMVTPLARRRPWVVARQATTLDHLTAGRLVVGVGLGNPPEAEFGAFGEGTSARRRAELLDEGLTILAGLWSGEPFSFSGRHHRLSEMTFLPAPVQRPRIPVWVAGYWPSRGPFRRAAHWDGLCPISRAHELTGQPMPLAELAAILDFVRAERAAAGLNTDQGFDIVLTGATPADRGAAAEILLSYADAGVTWWCEGIHGFRGSLAEMEALVDAGPPAA